MFPLSKFCKVTFKQMQPKFKMDTKTIFRNRIYNFVNNLFISFDLYWSTSLLKNLYNIIHNKDLNKTDKLELSR